MNNLETTMNKLEIAMSHHKMSVKHKMNLINYFCDIQPVSAKENIDWIIKQITINKVTEETILFNYNAIYKIVYYRSR